MFVIFQTKVNNNGKSAQNNYIKHYIKNYVKKKRLHYLHLFNKNTLFYIYVYDIIKRAAKYTVINYKKLFNFITRCGNKRSLIANPESKHVLPMCIKKWTIT